MTYKYIGSDLLPFVLLWLMRIQFVFAVWRSGAIGILKSYLCLLSSRWPFRPLKILSWQNNFILSFILFYEVVFIQAFWFFILCKMCWSQMFLWSSIVFKWFAIYILFCSVSHSGFVSHSWVRLPKWLIMNVQRMAEDINGLFRCYCFFFLFLLKKLS